MEHGIDLREHRSFLNAAAGFAALAGDPNPPRQAVTCMLSHYGVYLDLGCYGGQPIPVVNIHNPLQLSQYLTERDTIEIPGSAHFYPMVFPSDMRGISLLLVEGDIFCGNCLDLGTKTDLVCNGDIYMSPNLLRCRSLRANHVWSQDMVHVSGELDVQSLTARLVYRNGEIMDDDRGIEMQSKTI